MSAQTVTIQVDPSAAAILQKLMAQAEAQGETLSALLKPLVEHNGEPSLEPIENLLGVFDSREPFERPQKPRDAFGQGVIAKLEKQGLKFP
jgi:hypothetical protein